MRVALLARECVHKQNWANVFIAEPRATGVDAYETDSFFPTGHEFYNDCVSGLSASGYLIEVARQANLAICHRFLAVPLDAGFLVTSIDWKFCADTPFVVQGADGFVVRTSVVTTSRRKDALCRLTTRSSFYVDGRLFLEGGASFLISSRRAGGEAAPAPAGLRVAPLRPADAQVLDARDVLIGELEDVGGGAYKVPLVIDPTHSFFFEHENEHVPGMMLLEAGKQASIYAANHAFSVLRGTYGDLQAGEIRFGRFANSHDPISVTCELGALTEVRSGFQVPTAMTFAQAGREIGRISGTAAFAEPEAVPAAQRPSSMQGGAPLSSSLGASSSRGS